MTNLSVINYYIGNKMINTIKQLINYLRLVKLRDLIYSSFDEINRQLYQGDNAKLVLEDQDIVCISENTHRLYINTNIGNLYLIKQYRDKIFFSMYVGDAIMILDERLINNPVMISNLMSSYNNALDSGIITVQPSVSSDMSIYYTTTVRWDELSSIYSICKFLQSASDQVQMATTVVMANINMIKDFNAVNEEFNLEENDDDEYNNYADSH